MEIFDVLTIRKTTLYEDPVKYQRRINSLKEKKEIITELHTLIKSLVLREGFSEEVIHGWPISSEEPLVDQTYERWFAVEAENMILLKPDWKKKIMESRGADDVWNKACIDLFGVEKQYVRDYGYRTEYEKLFKNLIINNYTKEFTSILNKDIFPSMAIALLNDFPEITEQLQQKYPEATSKDIFPSMVKALQNDFPELTEQFKQMFPEATSKIDAKIDGHDDYAAYKAFWNNIAHKLFGIELFGIEFADLPNFKKAVDFFDKEKTPLLSPGTLCAITKLSHEMKGEGVMVQVAPRKSIRDRWLENAIIKLFLKLSDEHKRVVLKTLSKMDFVDKTWNNVFKNIGLTGLVIRLVIPIKVRRKDIEKEAVFRIFYHVLSQCGHYFDFITKTCQNCAK